MCGFDGRVVASSLFRIDVPSSWQHIRFGAKLTRMEMDEEVELRKILGPSDSMAGEDSHCGKIFQVFVVGDNVNCFRGSLKVVAPALESFKDYEQFFVVNIIV